MEGRTEQSTSHWSKCHVQLTYNTYVQIHSFLEHRIQLNFTCINTYHPTSTHMYSIPQYTTVQHSISQYNTVYLTVYHSISQYTTAYHNILHTQFRPHGCLGQLYHSKFCILHTIGTLGQKHNTHPHSSSIQSAYYSVNYSISSYLEGVNHSIVQHPIQVQRHIV